MTASALSEEAVRVMRRIAAANVSSSDLDYLKTNVLYARGSLDRETRRQAVVAIKTLRDVLEAARHVFGADRETPMPDEESEECRLAAQAVQGAGKPNGTNPLQQDTSQ